MDDPDTLPILYLSSLGKGWQSAGPGATYLRAHTCLSLLAIQCLPRRIQSREPESERSNGARQDSDKA